MELELSLIFKVDTKHFDSCKGKTCRKLRRFENVWTSKIAPVPFSLPLSSMVQTNLVNWNLIPAISKISSKNVIIVRSPKRIKAWLELAGWQYSSQSSAALKTKDWSKQWNLVGGVEEVLSRWLNGKPAICCCWSSGLWAGLAQLKPPPRYWIGAPRCSLQRLSFKQDQHCLDHTLTSLKRKVFSASNTIHNFLQCRRLFWLRVWTWQKFTTPWTILKNLMFQNFNLAIFRFPLPPSQDIGPLLPWPILPLPPRSQSQERRGTNLRPLYSNDQVREAPPWRARSNPINLPRSAK